MENTQHVSGEVWNNHTTLFDSHCHLQLPPLYENARKAIALALQLGVKHMAVCGTEPGSDWQKVLALAEAYPDIVIPSFGLHPWWIKQYYPPSQDNSALKDLEQKHRDHGEWLPELEALLQQHPEAGVGETGLDRGITKEVPYALQEEVLLEHMHLAGRYQRTLTLHCVGCWDRLLGLLNQQRKMYCQYQKKLNSVFTKALVEESIGFKAKEPPVHDEAHTSNSELFPASIILHSCGNMPIHLVQSFASLPNTYFSFSMGGRGHSGELSEKTKSFVRAIPIDRLLLETDSPDQLPSPFKIPRATAKPSDKVTTDTREPIQSGDNDLCSQFLQYNEPAMLRYHCVQLAQVLNISSERLAQLTTANSRKAFHL
uniref:Uncharacterized protein n=1 Tax=Spumella elongata TaxID=89044 RepID=A0A7S3H287_9STRA